MTPVKAVAHILVGDKNLTFTKIINLDDLPIVPSVGSSVEFGDFTKIYVENMEIKSKSEKFPYGCVEISQRFDPTSGDQLQKVNDYFKDWI